MRTKVILQESDEPFKKEIFIFGKAKINGINLRFDYINFKEKILLQFKF